MDVTIKYIDEVTQDTIDEFNDDGRCPIPRVGDETTFHIDNKGKLFHRRYTIRKVKHINNAIPDRNIRTVTICIYCQLDKVC